MDLTQQHRRGTNDAAPGVVHARDGGDAQAGHGREFRAEGLWKGRDLTGTTPPETVMSAKPPPVTPADGSHSPPQAAGMSHQSAASAAGQQRTFDAQERTGAQRPIPDPGIGGTSATAGKVKGRTRFLSMPAMLAAVFLLGASAGLTGAWWLKKPAASMHTLVAAPAASANNDSGVPVSARKGISSAELPYEGKAAPADENALAALPGSIPGNGELPFDGLFSSGGNDNEEEPVGAPMTPVKPGTKGSTAQPKTRAAANRPVADQDTTAPKNAVQAAPKVHPTQPPKDREIERIREQAAEELKKKTDNRRVAKAGQTSAASGNNREAGQGSRDQSARARVNKRKQLAICERIPSLISREACKWEHCAGMWGKNGCPSYDKPPTFY